MTEDRPGGGKANLISMDRLNPDLRFSAAGGVQQIGYICGAMSRGLEGCYVLTGRGWCDRSSLPRFFGDGSNPAGRTFFYGIGRAS